MISPARSTLGGPALSRQALLDVLHLGGEVGVVTPPNFGVWTSDWLGQYDHLQWSDCRAEWHPGTATTDAASRNQGHGNDRAAGHRRPSRRCQSFERPDSHQLTIVHCHHRPWPPQGWAEQGHSPPRAHQGRDARERGPRRPVEEKPPGIIQSRGYRSVTSERRPRPVVMSRGGSAPRDSGLRSREFGLLWHRVPVNGSAERRDPDTGALKRKSKIKARFSGLWQRSSSPGGWRFS